MYSFPADSFEGLAGSINTITAKSQDGNYYINIGETNILVPIGDSSLPQPQKLGKYNIIWNFIDNGRDFLFGLWNILTKQKKSIDLSDCPVNYAFKVYDQVRYDGVLEFQFVKIFKKIESLGYIKTYTVKPELDNSIWSNFSKRDNSIDIAFLDMSFKHNKLLMEQIRLLLWTPEDILITHKYFLTDCNNHQYLSETPAKLGGHCKLMIYGKLSCQSAKGFIEKGQYVQHRVFFSDANTAFQAGYRPCGKCMKAEYDKWKVQGDNYIPSEID